MKAPKIQGTGTSNPKKNIQPGLVVSVIQRSLRKRET